MKGRLKEKFCYASGDIYGGGAFMVFSLLFMNFLVLVEGLPVVSATLIIFIGKVWDAITDPIVGSLSDRTRSRFGRRRIFFLIGIHHSRPMPRVQTPITTVQIFKDFRIALSSFSSG